jgi:fumarate reductase subunit C
MTRHRTQARTYVRPVEGWWRRNPFFVRYMVREWASVLVVVYALVLLWGLACVAQGEAAFEAWRTLLSHPLSIVLHVLALPILGYHTWTWFQVMPKTLPRLPVAPGVITGGGLAASVLLSAGVLLLLLWGGR